ncbi:unnamed protein product, partial [Laminaria digitata]
KLFNQCYVYATYFHPAFHRGLFSCRHVEVRLREGRSREDAGCGEEINHLSSWRQSSDRLFSLSVLSVRTFLFQGYHALAIRSIIWLSKTRDVRLSVRGASPAGTKASYRHRS